MSANFNRGQWRGQIQKLIFVKSLMVSVLINEQIVDNILETEHANGLKCRLAEKHSKVCQVFVQVEFFFQKRRKFVAQSHFSFSNRILGDVQNASHI